tara:strand:- start:3353 stop:4414 length:1062 start_codon:yes stop_codon:yes gene_type:complete
MKYLSILTLSFLLLFSCSKKNDKQNQVKEAVLLKKGIATDEIIKNDSINKKVFSVTAKFNWFTLKDAKPYSYEFEKESGDIIIFHGSEINNFDFVIRLDESETSDFNKGWGTNLKLEGKWFKLTYINRVQPMSIDGPMETVHIIKKAVLDENMFSVRAKFVKFSMGDAEHYSFENEYGERIHFDGSEIDNIEFGIELSESESNTQNQGWGSNSKLQDKWFKLIYFKREQPLYIDGPMGTVSIIKKAVFDDVIEKEFKIRAKFVKFWLGDASHYSFETESGDMIVFEGSEIDNFEFGIELEDSESDSNNQGWGSNSKLLGKWFTLTYFERQQPMYIDGPMGTASIIKKAVLDEK